MAPFALAAPIQAPLAPQLSYASVAKSAAYQAVSGPELTAKKKSFSGHRVAEQVIRLVKQATKWQDSDYMPGVMIANRKPGMN